MLKCTIKSTIDVKKLTFCTQEGSTDFNANWTTAAKGFSCHLKGTNLVKRKQVTLSHTRLFYVVARSHFVKRPNSL